MAALINEYDLHEIRDLAETSDLPHDEWASHSLDRDESWNPFSFDEAIDGIIFGWEDAPDPQSHSDELDQLRERLEQKVNNFRSSAFVEMRDVAGSYVDIDRYMLGDPECMVEFAQDERTMKGRAIKVFINVVASWTYSAQELLDRGTRVLMAVEAAMSTGANIELWVGETIEGYGGNDVAVELVRLKGFHDYIDPKVAAFCIGHPSMLRRILFFLNELRPEDERRQFGVGDGGSHYGVPCRIPAELREQFDLVVESINYQDTVDAESIFESILFTDERIDDTEGV